MIPVSTNLQLNKLPRATLCIIAVNVLIFIFELLLPPDSLTWVVENLGFGPATRNPFAPAASIFLHGSIYHIASNMLFLWIFGAPVEERIGTKNFLIYYFGAGLCGGVLNVIMEIIARPDSTIPAIGASGAISGIMALFLYRCFYAKLKMVIAPILLPRQINIPVIPLVLFFFFNDVIMGIFSMSNEGIGVAHWAHIGGFVFGIAVGRIKKFGHDGQIEKMRGVILAKLEAGGGWEAAEKDLLKLLKIAPEDAEVHHDLARLYAQKGKMERAGTHFKHAVQQYLKKDPAIAGYTVLEHTELLSRPMDIQYHLKAAQASLNIDEYEDAYNVLKPAVFCGVQNSQLKEKSLTLYVKLCRHLDRKEEALEGMKVFSADYPDSLSAKEIGTALQKNPGEVFQRTKTATVHKASPKKSEDAKDADRLNIISFFEMIFADPAFWTILLLVNILSPIFFRTLYDDQLFPVYTFGAAFTMAIVHKMGSVKDILFNMSRPSQKKVRREAERARNYEDAVMAERKGDYPAAAVRYEKYLASDPKNVQARMDLVRIYDKQLGNIGKAKQHCHELLKFIPSDHLYYRDAMDVLKSRRLETVDNRQAAVE